MCVIQSLPNIAHDAHGKTPMHNCVAQTYNMTLIQNLVRAPRSNVNARDANGQTALHLFWTQGRHMTSYVLEPDNTCSRGFSNTSKGTLSGGQYGISNSKQ